MCSYILQGLDNDFFHLFEQPDEILILHLTWPNPDKICDPKPGSITERFGINYLYVIIIAYNKSLFFQVSNILVCPCFIHWWEKKKSMNNVL